MKLNKNCPFSLKKLAFTVFKKDYKVYNLSLMKKFEFNQEVKDICPYYFEDGYEIGDGVGSGGTASIYKVTYGDENLVAKKYNDNNFMHPYREFLLEFNIKSAFSIQPRALYKNDGDYFLVMDCFRQLEDFPSYFINSKGRKKVCSDELTKSKRLNILLIITSLLQAMQTLHVQKIPLIHHDIKPGNILLSENKLDEEDNLIKPSNIDYSIKKYINDHFYFSQLIDFGFTKENVSLSLKGGTSAYRTNSLYLESSDLFSVAIVLKLLIHDYTHISSNMKKINNFKFDRENETHYITEFYYKNKKKIKNLDIIVNMLIDGFKKRTSNIFDVMEILTTPEKFEKIFSEYINDEETIKKYFKILEKANIIQFYNQEFEIIAPKIYGKNYKAFLFTLFNQKNNKFDPDVFQKYQSKIKEIYNSEMKQYDIINKIATYHYEANFFSFKEIFEKFTSLFKSEEQLSNAGYSIHSKLFKILTSLNFKDTRSLNHFSNALNLSVSANSVEEEYDLEMCFGKDYQAKIGLMVLKSKQCHKEYYKSIVEQVKKSMEYREDLGESEIETEIFNQGFEISQFDTITKSFKEFYKLIHFEDTDSIKEDIDSIKEESINIYQNMTKVSDDRLNMLKSLSKDYGEHDAIFFLFMHYLYFYEYKYESNKRKSLSECTCKHSDSDDENEEEDEVDDNNIEKNKEIMIKDIEEKKGISLSKLEYSISYSLEVKRNKILFNWLIPFRFGNLITDILSEKTIDKLKNKIPVILFLRSLGVDSFEFHIFLEYLISSDKLDQFQRIVNNYNMNHTINIIASKLQFLESICLLFKDFYNIIIYKILQEQVEDKDFLEFIDIEKLVENDKCIEDINDSDIRTKISFPYVVYPFGKIKYINDKSRNLDSLDATTRSKIAVSIVHTINYLKNLPFKIPVHIVTSNILIDKHNKPTIILNPFSTDLVITSDDSNCITRDYTNYDNVLFDFKYILNSLSLKSDGKNHYLKIIENYEKISPSIGINASLNRKDENSMKSYLTFQYIFELYLDKSLDFTFKGTKLDEYNDFIDKIIKGPFYEDSFRKFAYELFGQSFCVKLDYLFTRINVNSNLTKESFVVEMLNIINKNKSTLLTILDDHKTLLDIASFLEKNFDEDPYNLVYRLRQLGESKINNMEVNESALKVLKYEKNHDLKEESIAYMYHIQNKFISPLLYSDQNNIYFKIPITKFKDHQNIKGIAISCKNTFYYSLKSALYYLSKYCDDKLLIPKKLTIEDIYINEMYEAIIPPFAIDAKGMKVILKSICLDLDLAIDIDVQLAIVFDSYASYIPLKDEHSIKLMKIFGLDYTTELNEILNSTGLIDNPNDDDNIENSNNNNISIDDDDYSFNEEYENLIFDHFKEKCEKLEVSDEYILELSSRVNKLTPLFIHLLEKASQSKIEKIKNEAVNRLEIFRKIIEIPRSEIVVERRKIGIGGECSIHPAKYNGKNVVFKSIQNQSFQYLQRIKNMLYLLRIIDQNEAKKYIINEIGFTNFGILMDPYKCDFQKCIENDIDKLGSEKNEENTKKEEGEKINIVERGVFYLKAFMQMIQDIKFLHSNNIVHYDIKFQNFLLTNEGIPLISDMINIQIEYSFFKSGVFSKDGRSKYLKSQKHQDTYSFEKRCISFLNKINEIYKGDEFQCPLIDEMNKNIKKLPEEKEATHPTIEYYSVFMSDKDMYFLPKLKVEKCQKVQINKFSDLVFSQGGGPTEYQDILQMDIQTIKDFNSCIKKVLALSPNDSKYISFFIKLSSKFHDLKKKKKIIIKKEKLFIEFIQKMDKIISDYFKQDLNERISKIVFERLYLNKLDDTKLNDEQIIEMKYLLLQYVKNEANFDDEFYEKIIYIIDFMEEIKDNHVGYFYTALFPPGKDRIKILSDDVLLRSRAVSFYYNYNTKVKKIKVNINDYKELILEIFQIISDQPDKLDEFKKWLIDTPQDYNVISLFFYLFSQNLIRYSKLSSLFDDAYNKFEEDKVIKNESNEYLEIMLKVFQFRKENSQKLEFIYKNYVIPSLNT